MGNRCFGLTRNLHRCSRVGDWRFFCPEHARQPLVWSGALVSTMITVTSVVSTVVHWLAAPGPSLPAPESRLVDRTSPPQLLPPSIAGGRLVIHSPLQNEKILVDRQGTFAVRGETSGPPGRRVVRVTLIDAQGNVVYHDDSPVSEDGTWRVSVRTHRPASDFLLAVRLFGGDGRQLASSSYKISIVRRTDP